MISSLFGGDKKQVAELIAAARTGDIVKVKHLLSKGADINAPEPDSGDTPLLAAIDKGQWATAEYLLKQCADFTIEDKNGNSPLYLAVSRGDSALSMVNLLLEKGAPMELGPKNGENEGSTPLHIACATGAIECLETLLRHGASATRQLPSGATPLHTAAIGGDQRTIELLCKAGGSVTALTDNNFTPLHNCAITGNAKAAAALIKHGAPVDNVDAEGWTPLMRAVIKNHADIARVLLENGANPDVIIHINGTPMYPLLVAALNGSDDVIRLLISNGANVLAKVEGVLSPLETAKNNGHDTAAKLIAAAIKDKKETIKAEVGPVKEIAALWKKIVQLVGQQDFESVKKCAAQNNFGALEAEAKLLVWTVLGNAKEIKTLLDAGANPNKTHAECLTGISPLYSAVGLTHNFEVAAVLLASGANPNLEWENGSTPIFEALTDQQVEFLKLLISNGADVNVKMINGNTPLIQASANNSRRCVDLLLDAGANINEALLSNGLGAFGVAVDRLKMSMALHLLSRGAKPEFGSAETLGLAVAEYGSIELIRAIEKAGGAIVRSDQLGRIAFVGSRNQNFEVLDHLFNRGADLTQENDCQYTPLILSVLRGHTKLVQRYAERGDDLDARDADSETALSLAIEKNEGEMISILRAHGAQTMEYQGLSDEESMLKASAEGNLGNILNLYDAGVSVNIQDDEGFNPLMLATKGGHLGVVRSLFHIGADINHRNKYGQSATSIATQIENKNLLATMGEFAAEDALPEALKGMRGGAVHDLADMMLGRKSRPGKEDIPYDSAPGDEVDEDDEDEVNIDDEPEESGPNAQEILEKLSQLEDLLARPNIAAKFEDAMIEKIIEDIQMIKSEGPSDDFARQIGGLLGLLENLMSEPEEEQLPPLLESASKGDLQEVKRLLKSGTDANSALPDGTTALMKAVEGEHSSVISELLKSGANVNLQRGDQISALLLACLVGNEDIAKILVANGVNIDEKYALASAQGEVGNNTVLTVAAQRAGLSMCKLLVELGANINAVTDGGYTPLMASLANGISEDIALYFLQQGANPDPDVKSRVDFSTSTTPLVLAASNGFSRVVKELIQQKVVIDKADGDGKTALKMAALDGHDVVVNLLIKAGAQVDAVDNEGWTALMNVAGKGNLEVAKILIKAGADANACSLTGVTPLIQAIGKHEESNAAKSLKQLLGDFDEDDSDEEVDSIEMIKLLLKQGASPNVDREGTSLLMDAEENDDSELVKLLKEYGASAEVSSASLASSDGELKSEGLHHGSEYISASKALISAIGQINVSRVKELTNDGADINYQGSSGNTPLSLAVSAMAVESLSRRNRRDLKEIADLLVNQGANLNLEGCDPGPLGMAAFVGDLHLVNAMLTHGAKTDAILLGQGTPLLAAISNSYEDCALALIRSGASVTSKSAKGLTALHGAAEKNLLKVVEVVLEKYPSLVNEVDQFSITPLMSAARAGNAEVVKILLRFQANRNCVDSDGLTALAHANANGHAEVAESLAQQS
jgi:ankyrin repeat protein